MAKRETEAGEAADSQLQELYKMGAELQQQQELLLQQLSKIGQAKHRSVVGVKSAQAALEYMGEARPEACVYKQIARLFVLESRGALAEQLREKAKSAKAEEQHLAVSPSAS
ncbi:hypothetical protein, conserved [Eimeria acervulina]|uniref:Prefoldin subunit n=1 Tax=Eimeria acervulina TaxID=5801 RepID=U6GDU8_EIMAC|nr:hypothetical protein, conserved [Eimeria acervulina]CDI78441.1 hypothetical protein, conserved [Eimeria acervulina]